MIVITELGLDRLEELVCLQKEFIETHQVYNPFYYQLAPDASNNFREYVKNNMIGKQDKIIYIARDEEKKTAAGYVSGWIEQRAPIYQQRTYGFLSNIFVRKDYQAQKVGRTLIETLFNWFKTKGIPHVELSVDAQNEGARKAFESCGFKEVLKRMRAEL